MQPGMGGRFDTRGWCRVRRATPRGVTWAARFVVVGLALLLGCGYGVVRYQGSFEGVETVAVRTLKNASSQSNAELMMTAALRKEFLRRGGLRLISDPDRADLVVGGKVLPIDTVPRSFSSIVLALEYEVGVAVEMNVRRRDGTALTIDRRSLRETELYLASSDVEVGRKNREEALRRIFQVLAGRVIDSIYLEGQEEPE